MAVIQGGTSGNLAEVDTTFQSMRTSIRPMQVLGWYSVGARSGALTGAGADTAVFSLRNISSNFLIIRRIGIGFVCTTGFTAAQALTWGLKFARSFTVADSGGTAIAITGSQNKHRTSLATPSSLDCRISSTGALTAGTKTLDTVDLATMGTYAAATTAGNLLPPQPNNLLQQDAGDYPIVLAQNEGLNIMNIIAMGAAGVGTLHVNLEFAEATSY